MVLSWVIYLITIVILANTLRLRTKLLVSASDKDWSVIEELAEQHPYIVALLHSTKDYECTGTIIDKRTVLTSGSCISTKLQYIAVGFAVLRKNININNLIEIASTKLHGDYIFDLKPTHPNVTRMHSNIGLVLATRPVLEFFFPSADIGNYFASELQSATLNAVGYGKSYDSTSIVLQAQAYHQIPCTNPKWYYCVCGIEYSTYRKSYEQEFGKGAPVFYKSEVAAITATPCGILTLKSMGVKYDIFTVVGPYLPWIEKIQSNVTINETQRATNNGNVNLKINAIYYFYVILVFNKLCS